MGIDINTARFLFWAHRRGVRFETTATIGRQRIFMPRNLLRRALAEFSMPRDARDLDAILQTGFAETLLQQLGAREIASFDTNDYEGATVVHDFNTPLEAEMTGRFSAVIDGGSLEHVFNFPVALRNALSLVRAGGHYLALTPANNLLGHGFYQFSPELYYRVLDRANGFELEAMFLYEDVPWSRWFSVTDPAKLGERVTLVNHRPSYLAILARRMELQPILETWPQQSDYAKMWEERDSGPGSFWDRIKRSRFAEVVYRYLPGDWKYFPPYKRRFFRRSRLR